jgi:hypothetical protein
MLFSLLYFLVGRVVRTGRRSRGQEDIELLVFRRQVRVLQRQVKRPRLHRLDRLLLAAASRAMPRGPWSSFVVRPETLLRWHRELVRRSGHTRGEGARADRRLTPRSAPSSSGWAGRIPGRATSASAESC